jgi:hypothetical protein
MAIGRAVISRSANNGPFIYSFEIDGDIQNAAVNVATISAALDAVKPLIATLPGAVQKLTIQAVSS